MAVVFALNSHSLFAQESAQDGSQNSVQEAGAADEIFVEFPVTERSNPEADIRFDELPDNLSATGLQGSGSVWVLVQMVLVLVLAALAIYGVVFFVKRLAKPKQALDPHLKVLASVPVGANSFAAVLSVGSKAWLVGGGESGLSLIAEIDEQEALESMLIDDAQRNDGLQAGRFPNFRSLLRRFTVKGSKGADNSNVNTFDFHAENLRKQRERLRGL